MKSSAKDLARGTFHQVKGEVKEIAGELSDNPKLEAEGIEVNLKIFSYGSGFMVYPPAAPIRADFSIKMAKEGNNERRFTFCRRGRASKYINQFYDKISVME